MAAGPGQASFARYRRRRGAVSLPLVAAHADALTVAAAQVAATYALYGSVSIWNNSQFGRYLHVVALSSYLLDAAADCIITRAVGTPPGAPLPAVMPVDPTSGQLSGAIYAGTVAALPAPTLWLVGGGGIPSDWPYDFPLAILGAGQYLQVTANVADVALHCSLAWLDLTFT